MKPFCAFIAMVAFELAGGQAFAQEAVSARGHFADLNRAQIYYEDHGSGEPSCSFIISGPQLPSGRHTSMTGRRGIG